MLKSLKARSIQEGWGNSKAAVKLNVSGLVLISYISRNKEKEQKTREKRKKERREGARNKEPERKFI